MMTRFVSRLLALAVLMLAALVIPADPAVALPPFACGTVTGGSAATYGHVTAVGLGTHPGYDRFVLTFSSSAVPAYTIIPKSSAVFWLDPSNTRVTLLGAAGIKVVVHPSSGVGTYHGPTDVRPAFPQLLEARNIGDFEGYLSWGVGLHAQSCKRVFTLTGPSRLVVDVPN